MLTEVHSWPTLGGAIKAEFFRTGPYTWFHIATPKIISDNSVEVSWKYEFADMGMNNNMDRTYHIQQLPDNSCLVTNPARPKSKPVIACTPKALKEAVFDHYDTYLKGLYESMDEEENTADFRHARRISMSEASTDGDEGQDHQSVSSVDTQLGDVP